MMNNKYLPMKIGGYYNRIERRQGTGYVLPQIDLTLNGGGLRWTEEVTPRG